MRNLVLVSTRVWTFDSTILETLAVDVEQESIYLASERQNADADVDIEIFKVEPGRQVDANVPIAMMTSPSFPSTTASQIISFRYLSEARSLALITRGGDIGVLPLDDEVIGEFDIVGSIDVGIKCASWCPDESIVAIVTGEEKLLIMTNTFDVLSEAPLHTTEHGEDQQVNVGWGSKQTQFHGSLGKTAAQTPGTSLDSIGNSPDDDNVPRISWRGDGAMFVVSSFDEDQTRSCRVLRVYDRQGTLQVTSEPVAGLEHVLCWRPSGNLITCSQRFGFDGGAMGKEGRHDIVFFERNGLRHGEFGLRESWKVDKDAKRRWGYRVRELSWNSDSTILAIWIERDEGDLVQLWTMGNYHWYLKHEIIAPASNAGPRRFTSLHWHPEVAMKLFLTTRTSLLERNLSWETHMSRSRPPEDAGMVGVVDGTTLLLTPFRTQNVPPPMSSHQLSLPAATSLSQNGNRTPIHVTFSPSNDALAILRYPARIEIWDLRTRLELGRGKAVDPVKLIDTAAHEPDDDLQPRQLCLWSLGPSSKAWQIACLSSCLDVDVIHVVDTNEEGSIANIRIEMPTPHGRLVYSDANIFWQTADGEIFNVDPSSKTADSVGRFPEFCFTAECITTSASEILFIGLAGSGKLHVASSKTLSTQCLASNCNSFVVAANIVIFTTTSHDAFFAPLDTLCASLSSTPDGASTANGTQEQSQWEKRRVERGSRIITAVSSTMSLVLQMPRGNLETINPRPLVLDVVRKEIDVGNYRKAFLACRKHRIDLNILVEHDQTAFIERLPSFIEQLDDVDHLNLFLTSLAQSSQSPATVAKLCDAVCTQLETRDIKKYINSILTAYVVKSPPDYELGLSLLLRLRDEDPDLVEEAVKYIIFLVDAERLFDTALGMYDFSLVLMIAQHSQRDPREYLPFLRELRALENHYQHFKIDDHLKRFKSALKNLHLAGQGRFDEAIAYMEKHRLYTDALTIWKDNAACYKRVLDVYGDWLFDRHDFRQAALIFVEAEKLPKAMVSYERALLWRELFEVALQENVAAEGLHEMAYRVADELSSKRRYAEAAQVLLDYGKDVRQSIATLAQGNHFSEARRLIMIHSAPDLLQSLLYPAALDSRAQLGDDIEEMRTQLHKQNQRLQELRLKKTEEPNAFYGPEDFNLHNVDVMTDVSMPATAFTRYTVAPTATSRASKQTSRSKRKMERKVGSGRKGTVDEEEYLLKSITKLAARCDAVQGDTENLLPHLMQFSAEHRAEGRALQKDLVAFKQELSDAIQEIWTREEDPETEKPLHGDSWASRMEEKRRERLDATDKVLKPELAVADWRIKLLDV